MPVELDVTAAEKGVLIVDLTVRDEDGDLVTPTTLTWTLTDSLGVVVNSRSAVSLTPASTASIVLQGDDLALSDSYYDTTRRLLIEGTYSSTIDGTSYTDLPLKQEFSFDIADLVGVS